MDPWDFYKLFEISEGLMNPESYKRMTDRKPNARNISQRYEVEPNAANRSQQHQVEPDASNGSPQHEGEPDVANGSPQHEEEPNTIKGSPHTASLEGEDFDHYWPLYAMIQKKNWQGVYAFVEKNPDALTYNFDREETLIDLIIRYGDGKESAWLIDKLAYMEVHLPPAQQNVEDGMTLTSCAESGDINTIKILLSHNPGLVNKKCSKGWLPVHLAALNGHKNAVRYLLRQMTGEKIYSGEDGADLLRNLIDGKYGFRFVDPTIGRDDIKYRKQILGVMAEKPLAFASGSRCRRWHNCIPVFVQTNYNQSAIGDIESLIVRSCGCFGRISNTFATSIKVVHDQKRRHMQAVEIVRIICEGVIWTNPTTKEELSKPFFKAARLGIVEFVHEIILAYSGSVYWKDPRGNTIFHTAVLYRRAEVFNLVRSSNFKKNWLYYLDNENNNILHFAGKLLPSSEVAGAALQMQRELQWFEAVKKLVHPSCGEAQNKQEQTPREYFTEQHRELVKEGEKWMKDTATSCSVVAALIITMVFAAAFTVPGGNDNGGNPNFRHQPTFIIFAISDGLALISAIISVLMFLGFLTSRYSEDDFMLSLPRKLIIGLVSLFFSIASTLVAFGVTIYLVTFHSWKWVFIPIGVAGCLPVALFASLQIPLLVDMFSSTYGRSIFAPR